jgi:hypothetical protein
MPIPSSFLAVFGPTPHSASTARSPITAIQLASVRVNTPPGLPKPVATFARCLLSLMPTEQASPVWAATPVRIRCASSCGSSVPSGSSTPT